MRIEIAGQGREEKVVGLYLERCLGGKVVYVRDAEVDASLGRYTENGYEPIEDAHDTALPTDSRGRVRVVGYTPNEEIEQPNEEIEQWSSWTPVNWLVEVPKDQGPVLVTANRTGGVVRCIQHHIAHGWRYAGTDRHIEFGGEHITAYRIVKPYGGE